MQRREAASASRIEELSKREFGIAECKIGCNVGSLTEKKYIRDDLTGRSRVGTFASWRENSGLFWVILGKLFTS